MFVRAVWRDSRLVENRQTLREMDTPRRSTDWIVGLSGSDLRKMTGGLFDRQFSNSAAPRPR